MQTLPFTLMSDTFVSREDRAQIEEDLWDLTGATRHRLVNGATGKSTQEAIAESSELQN